MKKMIQLKNVSKVYTMGTKEVFALDNLSLDIYEGEFVIVRGKSGSGKSTLLNIITGIDIHTSGVVNVNSKQLIEKQSDAMNSWRCQNLGIIFQFFQLLPDLTVLENVLLPMSFSNIIPSHQRKKRAKKLLTQVGLQAHMSKFPYELSGGEQQRCAIARALANDAPIIVADEPTGNLDSHTGSQILDLFSQLKKEGKTIIFVTHEKDSIPHSDRVIELLDGKLVQSRKQEVS